jgi:type I site-specific restriction endonuclease
MMTQQNEAFSRVLIDKAFEFSGWDLLDQKQVQFELHTSNGRADYLLRDKIGRVLCVLEAKREDLDPYDAKEQARGYAENLSAPFIILSNGREHWFWNYDRANQRDAYRIERLPSRNDLERLRLKNLQPPRPLQSEIIAPEYLRALKHNLTLRHYQIQAMDEIAKLFDREERRKFLLEMATGTGKTLYVPHLSVDFCRPAMPNAFCSSSIASNWRNRRWRTSPRCCPSLSRLSSRAPAGPESYSAHRWSLPRSNRSWSIVVTVSSSLPSTST